MSRYIDGFVLPVPRADAGEYERIARTAAEIWKEHGALEYWECLGDDLDVEGTRSFRDLVSASDDENVMFSWVVFESREARDAANAQIATDPRMAALLESTNALVDFSRMAFGGFRPLVSARASDAS